MTIRDEIIDELLSGQDPQAVFAKDGLLDALKKALAERVLNAELDHHLAEERAQACSEVPRNHRNGHSRKTVLSGSGKLELAVPRDRQASFEPQLIAKYRRRFPDFDTKVISLYARGLSMREIEGHLRELYGIDVSAELISTVTDAVHEQVAEWQNRPLEPLYPLVFFDALRVKVRDEGTVRNKAVYLALGVRPDGTKEALGLWIEQTEGAKFWLRVMNELRTRGVNDILIAVVDGLNGFPEAINATFPQTPGADVHCSPAAPFTVICLLERSSGTRRRPATDLHGGERQCRRRSIGRLRRRSLGPQVSCHRARMATTVGTDHSVLCLSARGTADHLHHQRDREPQQQATHRSA